ncbi:MAG: glycosyltransferase family 4 protein [Candidatus Hadarchaeum sp.]
MIKIVRIIARLNIGGPPIHVINLNSCLDPLRFSSLLVCGIENPGEGSMLDYAFTRGVQPISIPEIVGEATFKYRDLKALIKLYQLIRRERPHIVHTHTTKAGFLGRLAARLAGVPIVVHTYHGHVLHGYYGPSKTRLLRSMERALARLTDCLIAISELIKRDLVAYGVASAEKIAVIPLGFDLEPFLCNQVYKGKLRRELGLNEDARIVGIVGRIFPIKNHRLFLDAAVRVATREPNAYFVVVGDGILRSEMEGYAQKLGIAPRVFFLGWRRDLPRIYADLDLLVVSSDNEGTPVSAIEAMASGCPVVGTSVGGLPDIILEGETGYLVPPRDPEALAAAVLSLLQDREIAARMGQTARALAKDRFSLQRLVSDVQNLYESLLVSKGISV